MKKRYIVEIEQSVEGAYEEIQQETSDNCTCTNSAKACYDIVKEEYAHIVTRSDKLDNKVYITLTFCGFVFLFITGLIDNITKIKYPTNIQQLIVVVIYLIGALGVTLIFAYVLLKLVRLLSPIDMKRFDPNFITSNNIQKHSEYGVYTYTITKYTEAINYNEVELENKFREYNKCVKWLIPVVFMAFVLYFLKFFLI